MGIKGLLRALGPLLVPPEGTSDDRRASPPTSRRSISRKGTHHINQFAGRRLAVDVSAWLHKGAYSCAAELVESLESGRHPDCEEGTSRCVFFYTRYVLNRCEELINHAGVASVHLVFDGKRCPLKAGTNQERDRRRRVALEEARKLKQQGRNKEAEERYKTCIKATSGMENKVVEAVRQRWGHEHGGGRPKVSCIFSPYEADAQLAALCKEQIVDAVVTEDSDVLVYSAACGVPFPVIYKLDRDTGDCDVLTMDWLLSPAHKRQNDIFANMRRYLPGISIENGGGRDNSQKRDKGGSFLSSLRSLSRREFLRPGSGARLFVQACCLSGCDYAPSRLAGIGHVNAFKLISENAFRKDGERFIKVLRSLPKGTIINEGNERSPSLKASSNKHSPSPLKQQEPIHTYEELLARSESVFYYHRVLDIASGLVVSLTGMVSRLSHTTESTPESCRPCVNRFDDLSFIGIKDELTNSSSICKESSSVVLSNTCVGNALILNKSDQNYSGLETEGQIETESSIASNVAPKAPFEHGPSELDKKRDDLMSSIALIISQQAGSAYKEWSSTAFDEKAPMPSSVTANSKHAKRSNPFALFAHGGGKGCSKEQENEYQTYFGTRQEACGRAVQSKANRKPGLSSMSPSEKKRLPTQGSSKVDLETKAREPKHASEIVPSQRTDAENAVDSTLSLQHEKSNVKSPSFEQASSLPDSSSRYFSEDYGSRHTMSRKVSLESSTASPFTSRANSMCRSTEDTAMMQVGCSSKGSQALLRNEHENRQNNAVSNSLSDREQVISTPSLRYHGKGHVKQHKGTRLSLDSDDESFEELIVVGNSERTGLPKRQQKRLGTMRERQEEKKYVSPFQRTNWRRVTPQSNSKKALIRHKASPLMAGFARQRELSSGCKYAPEICGQAECTDLRADATTKCVSRKRKNPSSTLSAFFQPVTKGQRRI